MARKPEKTVTREQLIEAGFRHDEETNTWWDGDKEVNPQTGKHIRRLEASPCYIFFNGATDEDADIVRQLQQRVAKGTITVQEGVRKKDAGNVLDTLLSGEVSGYISVMVK